MIKNRCYANIPQEEKKNFQNPVNIVVRNDTRDNININKLLELNQPIIKLKAKNEPKQANKATWQQAHGIRNNIFIAIGAKIKLTYNLWVDAGLYNGSEGEVIDIIYNWEEPDNDRPVVILVKFDKYCGPSLEINGKILEKVVPIVILKIKFEFDKKHCTRENEPLTLYWGATIHSSQGSTMKNGKINLETNEMADGLSYVAFSRFEYVNQWIIEPVSRTRLNKICRSGLADRLQEEKRLKHLEKETIKSFYKITTNENIKKIIRKLIRNKESTKKKDNNNSNNEDNIDDDIEMKDLKNDDESKNDYDNEIDKKYDNNQHNKNIKSNADISNMNINNILDLDELSKLTKQLKKKLKIYY